MIEREPLSVDDLEIATYANCDRSTRAAFEQWISSLTVELDNEEGGGTDGAMAWIREQNEHFARGSIYATFIFIEKSSAIIVGTSSIVPDDRGIVKTYNLVSDGMFGLLNVRRHYRNRGIARSIWCFRENYIQDFVNRANRAMTFHFFTSEPAVLHLAAKHGFSREQEIYVEAFAASKILYKKKYTPARGGIQ